MMNNRSKWKTNQFISLCAVFLLASILLVMGISAGTFSMNNERHPAVEEKDMTCLECHKELESEAVEKWEKSKHGLNNVGCFICHNTMEEFMAHPDSSSCLMCHAEMESSLNLEVAKEAGCFSCHPAHSLRLH